MAIKVSNVPLGLLPRVFEKHGVERSQMNAVIGYLIGQARSQDKLIQYVDVGKSLDMLDLEMVPRTLLHLEAGDDLLLLMEAISTVIREGKLNSWVVKDHVLLLEMD